MSRPRDLFRSSTEPPMPLEAQPRVRVRLDSGLTLRAAADTLDGRGARLTAELPWLRIGATAQVELDVGTRQGRIEWIGIEPGPDGAARLAIQVTYEDVRARPDHTLPYFFDEALNQEVTQEEPLLPPPASKPAGTERVLALVDPTTQHRSQVALLRVAIVVAFVLAVIGVMGAIHH